MPQARKRGASAVGGVWTGAQKWLTGGITMLAALMALLVNAKNLGLSQYAGFVSLNVADHAAHRIVLTPRSDTLRAIGEPAVITATVTDARGASLAGATLRWRSTDSTIASVDSSGLIVARAPGRATIEVRVRDVLATAAVLVRPQAAHLRIGGDSAVRMADGDTRALSAMILDARGHPVPGARARWMPTDSAVVTVDSLGGLRAIAAGRAHVVGEFGELRDSVAVEVVLTPAVLLAVSGDGQRALAGRALPSPLVLEVRTRAGVPVAGVNVALAPEEGEGVVSPAQALSDAAGRVRVGWTLGGTAGAQRLIARVPVIDSALVLTAEADPLPANLRVEVLGDERSGAAGRVLGAPVRVRLTDTAGTALTAVRVAWSALDGGTAAGAERTDSLGIATAEWTLGPRAGAQRLLVQAGNPRFTPATTVRAAAVAGAAVSLAVQRGDRQRAPAGTALPSPVLVLVRDSLGNPVPGARVTAAASAGALADSVLTTDAQGVATARWTLGTKPGEQRLAFAIGGSARRATISVSATARIGPPATVTLRTLAPRAGAPRTLEAKVLDQHGNPVSGAMLQYTTTAGTLDVAQAKTDARGIATVAWSRPSAMRADARVTVRVTGTRISAAQVLAKP